MARMKLMNEVVNQAQDCIESLSELIATLKSDESEPKESEPKESEPKEPEPKEPEPKEPEPKEPEKKYSLEEVRAEFADLSRRGFREDIRALIERFGANKLSEIDPSKFTDLMGDARGIGNV